MGCSWIGVRVRCTVMRTTARTTNLAVILAGAGLSIVLIYALTSELFSRNSPTVLYNKACELIKSSPQVSPSNLSFVCSSTSGFRV